MSNFDRITESPKTLAGCIYHNAIEMCNFCVQGNIKYEERDCDDGCICNIIKWLNQPESEGEIE